MNCKPGDLAVIVRPMVPSNLGKFVTVIEALGWHSAGHEFTKDGRDFITSQTGFFWWCEAQSSLVAGTTLIELPRLHIADSQLRPIRDPGEDARDETLEWLKVPSADRLTESA